MAERFLVTAMLSTTHLPAKTITRSFSEVPVTLTVSRPRSPAKATLLFDGIVTFSA
jgi:hypothetical protein